jgi:predicted Zn-dependent protease
MEDEKRKEGEDAGQVHPAGEDWTPDSSIFIQMAESLRLQGRSEEAIETLRKGLEKMPDSLPGRLLLGRCLLEKGLFAEARKELETVARGVEECLPVYKMLSQVYLEEKDVDKALEVLRKTLYFQTAEETAGKKVTPLEMGLLHRGPHPPFVTPPSLVTPPAPQASPAPPEPPPARDASPPAQGDEKAGKAAIQTDTLAEIYIQQGHLDRALSVYQEILGKDPGNSAVKEKFEALKMRVEKENEAKGRKKVQDRLESWLDVVSSPDKPDRS